MLVLCSMGAYGQNVTSNSYRGFVDAGYSIGIGDYEFGRVEINTSHGYQFNPYIYLGAGIGLHMAAEYKTKGMNIALDTRKSKVDIPIFGNIKANLSKGKIAPFIDGKIGYFVNNNGGLYANLSAGIRIATNEKQAVNVYVGYSSEELEFETFKSFTSSTSMNYTRSARKLNTEAISIRVGYEF